MTTRTITLTLTVTDAEATALVNRFVQQANAVTDDEPGIDASNDTVDVRGIPYNPEFHAATKTKNQDQTWKAKKGHDKVALAAWEKTQLGNTEAPFEMPKFLQKPDMPATVGAPPAMPGLPPMTAPAPQHPTYQEMLDAFAKTAERIQRALSQEEAVWIYQYAGVTDTNTLADSGEQRSKVVEALDKIGR